MLTYRLTLLFVPGVCKRLWFAWGGGETASHGYIVLLGVGQPRSMQFPYLSLL